MSATPAVQLESISRALQRLHALLLRTEREFHPPLGDLELLERLVKDPAWAWMRPLSMLVADVDHVLALPQAPTVYDVAVVATHARELLAGEGSETNAAFLERYRPMLQLNPELVSTHGELKTLLKAAPTESANEAERLHHRHQWAMRCKHRSRSTSST